MKTAKAVCWRRPLAAKKWNGSGLGTVVQRRPRLGWFIAIDPAVASPLTTCVPREIVSSIG
ncbi:hypothetical protein GCM10027277_37960 [Pseudoduganella ginsengisoli]